MPNKVIQDRIARLWRRLVGAKSDWLGYLGEIDLDPALCTVAHHAGYVTLRKIAEEVSILGDSESAANLVTLRDEIALTPRVMLPLLDVLIRNVRKRWGNPPKNLAPLTTRTLAERRAKLVVMATVDERGQRVFADADFQRVCGMNSEVLNRLYLAAAGINRIPLPPTDPAETTIGNHPPVVPHAGRNTSITTYGESLEPLEAAAYLRSIGRKMPADLEAFIRNADVTYQTSPQPTGSQPPQEATSIPVGQVAISANLAPIPAATGQDKVKGKRLTSGCLPSCSEIPKH